MIGASISTMDHERLRDGRLAWLLVALALMVAGGGFPAVDLASPDTLVLVHVVLYRLAQCGHVRRATPVRACPRRKTAIFGEVGAAGLGPADRRSCLAARRLPGIGRPVARLALASSSRCLVLLIAGFGLIVVDLGLTAWLRPTGPARFVLVGLASLCATVAFGAVFAFALAGWAGSIGQSMLASGVPLHAIAGLGGWLTLTAMGASYRLLSMFMLAPDVDDRKSNTTLLAGALATTVAVAGGVAAITLSFRDERRFVLCRHTRFGYGRSVRA